MGAQTPERANRLQRKFEDWSDETRDPFHYETHYSSAGVILGYLQRLQPYRGMQAHRPQGGGITGFDSVAHAWSSASARELEDVRELIPEFFYLPDFLAAGPGSAAEGLDEASGEEEALGKDVALPPWCDGDPACFVRLNREALESEHVSAHLHEWIDLVFGYLQHGPDAARHLNVFNPLSYEGGLLDALNNAADDAERDLVMAQTAAVGQTPVRVFVSAHPKRHPQPASYTYP